MKQITDLSAILKEAARQCAGKTAIIFGRNRLSYTELDEASNKIANTLLKMTVRKGDRVVMLLNNSPTFATVFFGIIKAGGIAVPLDPNYKVEEFISLFSSCQPRVLIAESDVLESLITALPQFSSIEHVIDAGSRYKDHFLSYEEIMATSSSREVKVTLHSSDIGIISYTGGPTYKPRGAVMSHYSLVTEAILTGDGLRQTEKDVTALFALPLYHMFGLSSILLTSVYKQSTIAIIPGTGRSITNFLEVVERERATIYFGVPYIYGLMVKMAEHEGVKYDLSSIHSWYSGGATLPHWIKQQFRHYYGADLLDIWGLTEAISQVTYHPLEGKDKVDSTGKALPCWEIRIVDDNGNELPPNQTGEVTVRGPIMKEYYNNPQATAEAIKDGWLHTGDLGSIDKDGYLFLAGKKKNVIISKGQNIYGSDIEEVLHRYYKVSKAIVVGIPDRLRGEIIGTIIMLKRKFSATESEIKSFCKTHLASYKLPKKILFVKSLPKRTFNKISKSKLWDRFSTGSSLPSYE